MQILRRILECIWVLLLGGSLVLKFVYKTDIQHYHLRDIFMAVQCVLLALYLYLFICFVRRELAAAKNNQLPPQ